MDDDEPVDCRIILPGAPISSVSLSDAVDAAEDDDDVVAAVSALEGDGELMAVGEEDDEDIKDSAGEDWRLLGWR